MASAAVSGVAGKALVRRFYRDAINERDSRVCERLLSRLRSHRRAARAVGFTSTAVPRVRDGLIAQAWTRWTPPAFWP